MVPTMGAKTINHAPTNGVVGDFDEALVGYFTYTTNSMWSLR